MSQLTDLVSADEVLMHSIIIGELACGNLSSRQERLSAWRHLPMILEASHDEVLSESRRLMGRGIGFMDAHAVLNRENTLLWTRDGSLRRVAGDLGVALRRRRSRIEEGWREDKDSG